MHHPFFFLSFSPRLLHRLVLVTRLVLPQLATQWFSRSHTRFHFLKGIFFKSFQNMLLIIINSLDTVKLSSDFKLHALKRFDQCFNKINLFVCCKISVHGSELSYYFYFKNFPKGPVFVKLALFFSKKYVFIPSQRNSVIKSKVVNMIFNYCYGNTRLKREIKLYKYIITLMSIN